MPEALEARLEAQGEKLDAVHLSLEKDISELKGMLVGMGERLSASERQLATVKGIGIALMAGMPFIVLGLQTLIHS